MARLQGGRILGGPVRAALGPSFERSDAFARQWMRLHIRIDVLCLVQHLVRKPLERVIHALWRLPGRCEKFYTGAIGLLFLVGQIGEQRGLDGGTWSRQRTDA